jgi:hypothetical protein
MLMSRWTSRKEEARTWSDVFEVEDDEDEQQSKLSFVPHSKLQTQITNLDSTLPYRLLIAPFSFSYSPLLWPVY